MNTTRLAPGAQLEINGGVYEVTYVDFNRGVLTLRASDGGAVATTFAELLFAREYRITRSGSAPPRVLEGLTAPQRDRLDARVAHLLEAETGYRSGTPSVALPGEPRPQYDPAITPNVTDRRKAKAAELDTPDHKRLRLKMALRTLERMAAAWYGGQLAGCIDGRAVRASPLHKSVSEELEEAIEQVHASLINRSNVSMRARVVLIHKYIADHFDKPVHVPNPETLRRIHLDKFPRTELYGRSRTRRSAANRPRAPYYHAAPTFPGELVVFDSTVLDVFARDMLYEDAVRVILTLALDVYSHSIPGFRLTLVSDKKEDVTGLLRDIIMPKPMRPDWGEELAWPYLGVPAQLVAEYAGGPVAGVPFFTPQTVVVDHGAVFKNFAVRSAVEHIDSSLLPAAKMRPEHKAHVENTFNVIRQLLVQFLDGYKGSDVSERGADPEAEAIFTRAQLEHVIATWIVSIWQRRAMEGVKPDWAPEGTFSPNSLLAFGMAQTGFALPLPNPNLYYELLPASGHAITPRGVKVRGLWYWDDALMPYIGQRSRQIGRFAGKWIMRSDARDRRTVFFQDPGDPATWHHLRWTGAAQEIPAFNDKTTNEMLRVARSEALRPRHDAELLPVLLRLIADAEQAAADRRHGSKRVRTSAARQVEQGLAAAADRGDADPPATANGNGNHEVADSRTQVEQALDQARRQARELSGAGDSGVAAPLASTFAEGRMGWHVAALTAAFGPRNGDEATPQPPASEQHEHDADAAPGNQAAHDE